MIAKFDHTYTGLDIPKHAGHITRAGNNLSVIEESAAAEVTRMCAELASALARAALLGVGEAVDRADIVKTTTCDEVARRRVSAGHDPAGTEGYSVDFVCRVSVPNDEFAVLGSGDEMPAVCRPMHSVDFGKMTP